jgi:hypothetical protein
VTTDVEEYEQLLDVASASPVPTHRIWAFFHRIACFRRREVTVLCTNYGIFQWVMLFVFTAALLCALNIYSRVVGTWVAGAFIVLGSYAIFLVIVLCVGRWRQEDVRSVLGITLMDEPACLIIKHTAPPV